MDRVGIAFVLAVLWCAPEAAWSQSNTFRYPRVYGATGRPYGPTQAHYQYQKQYGHPWHGYGGLSTTINPNLGYNFVGNPGAGYSPYGYLGHQHYGGCGYGYGGYGYGVGVPGYADFGPIYSYVPMAPLVLQGHPQFIGPNPLDNAVLNNARLENDLRWNQPLDLRPAPGQAARLPVASTPESKLKSLRAQAQGDTWFQQQEYHKAFDRYKAAVSEAPDQGEAHYRLALSYASLGHFDLAARQIKRGLAADPHMAAKAETLEKIFGPQNAIAQTSLLHRVTRWTKDDIRDPDRLFLLGVLLYLDGDERASVLWETGMRLAGGGDHFRGFLLAATNPPLPAGNQAGVGESDEPQPVVPEIPPQPPSEIPPADRPLPNSEAPNQAPPGPEFPSLPTPDE